MEKNNNSGKSYWNKEGQQGPSQHQRRGQQRQQPPSQQQRAEQPQEGARGGTVGDNVEQGFRTRGQQFPETWHDVRGQGNQSQGWGRERKTYEGSQEGDKGGYRGGGNQRGRGDRGGYRGKGRDLGKPGGYRAQSSDLGGGTRRDWQFEGRGGFDNRGQRNQFRGERGGQRPDFQQQGKLQLQPSTVKFTSQTKDETAHILKEMSLIRKETPNLVEVEDKNWDIPIPMRENASQMGTRGRKILIEVNHLKLTLTNTRTAFHYDVTLNPNQISKKIARRVMEEVRKQYYSDRFPAFDGKKNLYSSGKKGVLFNRSELNVTISLPRDDPRPGDETFDVEVTIKPAKPFEVDLTKVNQYLASRESREGVTFPQEAIQVLDIVLRNPASLRLTQVGRSLFFTPPNPGHEVSLGGGMDLWFGHFQSAVLGWSPYLNVDVAHKGFPQAKDVLSIMLDIKEKYTRNNSPDLNMGLGRMETEEFEKLIKGLKISYKDPSTNLCKTYKVIGIKQSADKQKFKLDNGLSISVKDYFKREKKYNLQYPNLPVLHVGNPQRTNFIPPEFCKVLPNQIVMKKLDDSQKNKLIIEAAKPPRDRKRKIMAVVDQTGFNKDECIQEFGVSVDDKFLKVEARILCAPKIEYQDYQVPVVNGVWAPQKFVLPKALEKWAVISLDCDRLSADKLWSFADNLIKVGKDLGMDISRPQHIQTLKTQTHGDQNFIRNHLKTYSSDCQLILAVFNKKRNPDMYFKIKSVAETSVGLLTQCIRDETVDRVVDRGDFSTIKNILLKINTKLGGINHTIISASNCESVGKILDGAMLMGADVTHPPPEHKTAPSVAAVTATHDPLAFKYSICLRLQPPTKELIFDMRGIMRRMLLVYRAHNQGRAPKKIIFYRDGVSEGQFMQVLGAEMRAIHEACLDILQRKLPVTFIVVQKRHHTRFFPLRPEDCDRNGNPLAGTVVDSEITHPREADFFLVSHGGIKGTSRPTKYRKLYDDNNISLDDLQELTYYLCHSYCRCTRSVSYPAPTYYAHLAATRGKGLCGKKSINSDNLLQEMESMNVLPAIMDKHPMFFT